MENNTAQIILANLRERVEIGNDGKYRLPGILTQKEIDAIEYFISEESIEHDSMAQTHTVEKSNYPDEKRSGGDQCDSVDLDLSTLGLSESDSSYRVCIDFGTAMSKATFVYDGEGDDLEEIHVLKLGIPGDQEQIDSFMLVSSVFIDLDGYIWFGKHAVDRSQVAPEGANFRIDNIKRALSEGNLDEAVDAGYNPTAIHLSYGDIVLAYLTFLTWTINYSLATDIPDHKVGTNFNRRFAMPCFPRASSQAVESKLKAFLGEAQVLADTFKDSIHEGLSLEQFMLAIQKLRLETRSYKFVERSVIEPLGVAGSLMSWRGNQDSLALVVDIGAGTSDFSLYRLKVVVDDDDEVDASKTIAGEVDGTAKGITEAGNHLDKILMACILKKAGIDGSHKNYINITHSIERDIRSHKESLFNSGSVFIVLHNDDTVEIKLDEFLQLEAVRNFQESLNSTMVEILEAADPEWINWVRTNPSRYIAIVLTGGGASLPMARSLAEGEVVVHGVSVAVALAKNFPKWLSEDYPDLEDHYSRIAVSLGGARQNTFRSMGVLKTTGSGLGGYALESFPTRGN